MLDHTNITRRERRAVITALMVSTFLAAMEVTVIATVMPSITADLGGFSLYAWAFGIYLLAQGVMTPVYGRLSDLFGRKRTYLVAASLFLIGSLLCGLASNMVALIAFRGLQGLGAGGIAPIASTIMADISAPADRPKAVGYISTIYGLAAIFGPLAGAALVHLGWPLVFWINLPFGLVAMTLVARNLPEASPQPGAGVDVPGAVLLTLGGGGLMLAMTQSADMSWPVLAATVAVGIGGIIALVWQQRRALAPLVPPHFWRNRLILMSVLYGLISGAYLISLTAFLPTWVQGVDGGTPLEGGITLSFIMVTWTVGVLGVGRVIPRLPYRVTALAGTALILLGSFGPVALHAGESLLWIRLAGIAIGVGSGMANLTFTVAIQSSVAWGDRGRATAAYFFSRILGQALGAAAFGGLLNGALARALPRNEDVIAALLDPVRRALLDPVRRAADIAALDQALHLVYQATWVLALLAVLLALCLPARATLEG